MVEPPSRKIEFRRDYPPGESLQHYWHYTCIIHLVYGKVNGIHISLKESKLNLTLLCHGLRISIVMIGLGI
jgi:hypothetical protein